MNTGILIRNGLNKQWVVIFMQYFKTYRFPMFSEGIKVRKPVLHFFEKLAKLRKKKPFSFL